MLPLGLETVWKTEQKQVASAASFETLPVLRQESFYPGSVFWNSSRWNLHYVINENNIKNGLLAEIRAACLLLSGQASGSSRHEGTLNLNETMW